jgi:hypothetical protein
MSLRLASSKRMAGDSNPEEPFDSAALAMLFLILPDAIH